MKNTKTYGVCLSVLLLLFVFRVLAQLIQAVYPIPVLPPFEVWQSGALPYGILLGFQTVIILVMSRIVWMFLSGKVQPKPKIGMTCLFIGGLYLGVMYYRLIAGYTFAAEHPWLGAHVPTFFHFVLATFLLLVGLYHSPQSSMLIAKAIYPAVMVFAITAHFLLLYNGMNLHLATYPPILIGMAAILVFEHIFPHRKEWSPSRSDVLTDTTYMSIVQVLLPRVLGFMISLEILNALSGTNTGLHSIWPHTWPVAGQMVLMLVTAEFFRYWLHRVAHHWAPLWRLHAVHHSPHVLYSLNVGRFHPLEKMIQYLFDALPFILMGISEEVLALYFVFYALNGFFQHCNIELNMGFLNYIISGPELHRWHHSKIINESDKNFGNNLIIWDLLFGTWYLPKHLRVGDLGLINRNYPMRFMQQLKAPFIAGLDKVK